MFLSVPPLFLSFFLFFLHVCFTYLSVCVVCQPSLTLVLSVFLSVARLSRCVSLPFCVFVSLVCVFHLSVRNVIGGCVSLYSGSLPALSPRPFPFLFPYLSSFFLPFPVISTFLSLVYPFELCLRPLALFFPFPSCSPMLLFQLSFVLSPLFPLSLSSLSLSHSGELLSPL